MGSLSFCTQFWETLKKINTISWTPDNPLAGVKSRQDITKPTKYTSPMYTPAFSVRNAPQLQIFFIIIPNVPHKVVGGFFPL